MADNLPNIIENQLLDALVGTTAYTMTGPVKLALVTANGDDASAGTEVTGGSYARQTIAFDAAASGATQNSGNIDFANMPACTVVAVGIFDAASAGNLLVHGTLTANKTLDAGDTLRIATGDLDISID